MLLFQSFPGKVPNAAPLKADQSDILTPQKVAIMSEKDCGLLISISNSGNQQKLPSVGSERLAVLNAITNKKMQLHCPDPSAQPAESSKPVLTAENPGYWGLGYVAVRWKALSALFSGLNKKTE